MILQINDSKEESTRHIDGIRHLKVGKPNDPDEKHGHEIDLIVTGPEEIEKEVIIVCQLAPKYGDREYIILLKQQPEVWLLNDEGKTLKKIS